MTGIEKGAFLKLFNRGGYVLDFSTAEFDVFTMGSVGVALCEKYGMSKGKSLNAFCYEAEDDKVVKLLSDMLEYYEINYKGLYDEEKNEALYQKCQTILKKESTDVRIETPAIVCVNRDYIRNISARAIRDVENGEYDSAITKSRTLLEEVFCFVIEKKGAIPSEKGDINKLYNQVKELYNMHAEPDMDKRINKLLSGLEKIIDAIAEMRNKNSDAHGVGLRRINIAEYHARLFVNASMTIAEFILSVGNCH